MQKINKKTLIIIILATVLIAIAAFVFLRTPRTGEAPTEGSTGLNFLANLNPFRKQPGQTSAPTTPTEEEPTTLNTETNEDIKLKRVSSVSVAGFTIFQKERYTELPTITPDTNTPSLLNPTPPAIESVPAVRYTERATGNIYQAFADKLDERKFSTTIIPRIVESYFGGNGDFVIMRYLKSDGKSIASFSGTLPEENAGQDSAVGNELTGLFLPDGISDMSVSPDGLKVFYILNIGQNTVGVTSGMSGENKVQVFESSFNEWLTFWPNNQLITLTTKPSASVPGYMYALNPSLKSFRKVLGGINGLTTLTSPSGNLILWGDNIMNLNIYDTETRETTNLSLRTLPEKCTWSRDSDTLYCSVPDVVNQSNYPDIWYKGEVSFSDSIWRIDVASNTAEIISTLYSVNTKENMDNIKLSLDANEDYLFFVNKKDSYLWQLSLD